MECRFCTHRLGSPLVSLGNSPIANAYLTAEQLMRAEPFYPLELYVCGRCFLVQLPEFESPQQIFSDYAYFSSFSDSWLTHARTFAEYAIERFALDTRALVVEAASNDGYLLQYFKERGIPVLGVEPAANVAREALRRGIPTEVAFFGEGFAKKLATEHKKADLIVANNVLAHVPGLNDFVLGFKALLGPHGVISVEFPHLLNLIEQMQFDTIYHEHFSYLSLTTVDQVFRAHGLRVFDVAELSTHGGSLRVFACHLDDEKHADTGEAAKLKRRESEHGLFNLQTFTDFNSKIQSVKHELLRFLLDCKAKHKTVVAYGAPAKGNTLLNYCGIKPDLIEYTVDRNPRKQDRFLPGSHIPIFDPEKISSTRPDFVVILPWNLKDEIVGQLDFIRKWGGRCVIPVPQVSIL